MDPSEIRARKFNTARRGYERFEVDEFLGDVSDHVQDLDERLSALEATMRQLGIDEPVDVAAEIERVGADLTRILSEATGAAEQMRDRASEDAARWRAEANDRSRATLDEARQQAEALRESAWMESSQLIEGSAAEAVASRAAGEQDALFIRAEAEREALRLTGDARRDAEENLRAARQEAERLLDVARRESDVVLESARQQADAAQERARALEQRRAELMEELEAARASIGQLEEEFDTRRQELVEDEVEEGPTHWPADEGGVRIVPRERALVAEPVDALEIAAEVEALRAGPQAEPTSEPGFRHPEPALPTPVPSPQPSDVVPEPATGGAEGEAHLEPVPWLDGFEDEDEEEATGHIGAVAEAPPEPEPEPESEPEREPEPEPEPEPAPEPAPEPVSEPELDSAPEPESQEEVVAEEEPAPAEDAVSGLFASLRSDREASPERAEAVPVVSVALKERGTGDVPETAVPPSAEPSPEPAAEAAPGQPVFAERALAVRERLLLPSHNRALRTVKRGLVDLQNLALEDLRVDEGWEPNGQFVAGAFEETIETLSRESIAAGYAAAAELTGSRESPQPQQPDIDDPVVEFTSGLRDVVLSQIVKSRASGAGPREVAAAVSKVFRAWRTDEAERRLRAVSYRAYHAGLLAGLSVLGVAEVVSVVVGIPCEWCPSNAGAPWPPGEALPAGSRLPPVLPICQCTVAPIE